MSGNPVVEGFHEPRTGSVQYVVSDPATGAAAILDPVLDFDPLAGAVSTRSADALLGHVRRRGLRLAWVADTHPHADHLSAVAHLRERTGVPALTGAGVTEVARLWRGLHGLEGIGDPASWDRLLSEGEEVALGSLSLRVWHSPGHTLSSITLLCGDAALIHDTLFMPDSGTARADFPGGGAAALWRSIQRITSLPEGTRLFTGHDYRPEGRPPAWESTVAQQRAGNDHLRRAAGSEAAFVALREERDRGLPLPALMLLALQVNLDAGRLPAPDASGRRHLRLPLGAFDAQAWR